MANANMKFLAVPKRLFRSMRFKVIYQINKQKIKDFFRDRVHLGHWEHKEDAMGSEILV